MSLTLNKNCIDGEIGHYLAKLSEVKEPVRREVNTQDSYRLLKFIKRHPLGVGPYPDVSLFEKWEIIYSPCLIDTIAYFVTQQNMRTLTDRMLLTMTKVG